MPIEIADLMWEFGVYIRLVWLFVIIITVLMLLLCYLYLAKRKALERESTSFEFSNLIIEGVETERRRVSRELHDNVLSKVRGTEIYNTVREICVELMPPDFSRFSLNDALVDMGDKFTKRTGIECVISVDKELDFTPFSEENRLHLYRMVQEALTNIEKHAKASKAFLIARRGGSENIIICVSDEGQGLQSKQDLQSKQGLQSKQEGTAETGLGMRSMRQRAAIIGAQLDFISVSGNGLLVQIEIPGKR
jgi:two-component system NarL family sensor kinase